jgi:hypothetical protein
LANGKSPPVFPIFEKLLLNVEGLNDARMLPGKKRVSARRGWADETSDFFSILLEVWGILACGCVPLKAKCRTHVA